MEKSHERFHIRKDLSLQVSSICSAFKEKTVGTKVTHHTAFQAALAVAIENFDMPPSGQGVIPMDSALDFVSGSMARIDDCTEESDLCVRNHRGKWGVYAQRHKAVAPDSLSCVVYTKMAYLADPDITAEATREMMGSNASHVLVAVLAACGPKSPLPPQTLLHNIAGGNNEFIPKSSSTNVLGFIGRLTALLESKSMLYAEWLAHDLALLHTVIKHAQETESYWSEWMLVAD